MECSGNGTLELFDASHSCIGWRKPDASGFLAVWTVITLIGDVSMVIENGYADKVTYRLATFVRISFFLSGEHSQ